MNDPVSVLYALAPVNFHLSMNRLISHIIPNVAQGCIQINFSHKVAKLAKCNSIFFLAFFAALHEIL